MKHKIVSDTHADFIRNMETLYNTLNKSNRILYKSKIKMKTFNSDYTGYRIHYSGVFWDTVKK